MGAKTAFAAAIGGDPRRLVDVTPDPAAAAKLVADWFPGTWLPGDRTTLDVGIYPRDDVTALRVPGIDVVGADEVLTWTEPPLPARILEAVGERRLIVHQMHSVNESMGFLVWQSGELVRALGMDADNGVFLNVGEPTPAEDPFWRDDHPEDDDYPLPIHPLELAEETLRAELGFVLEGIPGEGGPGAYEIPMFTFTAVPSPSTRRGLFRRWRWRWGSVTR